MKPTQEELHSLVELKHRSPLGWVERAKTVGQSIRRTVPG